MLDLPASRSRRMMRVLVQSTIVVLGCTTGCARTPPAPPATTASARPTMAPLPAPLDTLPDLALPSLAAGGEPLALRSLRGQVVLLDIWASWCAPCREEMPLLDQLARRHEDKGVRVVALSVDDDREAALEFLRSQPSWRLRVAHDVHQEAARALQPPKMPTSYVVDRQGRVRYVHAGFERADAARIEGELLALAQQPAP